MNKDIYSLIRRSDNKILPVPTLKTIIDWSYVKTRADSMPGQKFLVPIDLFTKEIEEARSYAYHAFIDSSMTPDIACNYLYCMSLRIDCQLLEDWESYKIVIGYKGDMICPIDLVDFVITNIDAPDPTAKQKLSNMIPECDRWLYPACCFFIRLAFSSTEGDYSANLSKKFLDVLRGSGCKANATILKIISFSSHLGVIALAAIIDMFFNRFPNHPFSIARLGTVMTRWQDCSIITSLLDTLKSTNLSLGDLSKWAFCQDLCREFSIILTSPDELSELHSFTPYLRSLQLVTKSPYSVSVCPNIHMLLHILGCFFSIPRSIHARYIASANQVVVPRNAVFLAYAIMKAGTMRVQFIEESFNKDKMDRLESLMDSDDEDLLDEETEAPPPSTAEPFVWFAWMAGRKFKYNEEMKTFIKHAKASIVESRAGSIGTFFKNSTLGSLD